MIDVKILKKPKEGQKTSSINIYSSSSTSGSKGDSTYHIKENDATIASDNNAFTALRTRKEIAEKTASVMTDAEGKFLSRLSDDVAKGNITFEQAITVVAMAMLKGGAEFGEYVEKTGGAKIDAGGNAEVNELLARAEAVVEALKVKTYSTFLGQLSSERFQSGFVGGTGWAILKQAVLNAAGETENKYTAEFDNVVVRGVLRVFTMVISQLLGENDNRIFTAMMEVDHYDKKEKKVYLKTENGKYYNPFRVGDYIMVQQYNGMPSESNSHYITKHYECIVTAVGVGSEGENRLDWVTVSNFISADGKPIEDTIAEDDTFVRVDNATDADRKGIIQIITVGTATPYMDIIYGLKTDPDNYLKGRIGNLQGIRHPLFGWLSGFGEYLSNLYAVGDFRSRQTGDSLDSSVQMLSDKFATSYQKQVYDITEEDDYLTNASFTENMDGWTAVNDTQLIRTGANPYVDGELVYDGPLVLNGSLTRTAGAYAVVEQYDGRNMLHINSSSVTQANSLIRQPGTHTEYYRATTESPVEQKEVKDTLYLTLKILAKTDGVLCVGMPDANRSDINAMQYVQTNITASIDWQTVQVSGTWDGKGDFMLSYTGNMYVALLSLTDKPLDEYKKTMSTGFVQTNEYISATANRVTKNQEEYAEWKVEADKVITTVGKNFDTDTGKVTVDSGIVTTANSNTLYNEWKNNGKIVAKADIETCVTYDRETGKVMSGINMSADQIEFKGHTIINGNFEVDTEGNMTAKNANISGTVNATSGTFTGTVNANDGTIGSLTIDENKNITDANKRFQVLADGNIYIGKVITDKDTTGTGEQIVYVGGVAVTKEGNTKVGGFDVTQTSWSSAIPNAYMTIADNTNNRRATIGYDSNSSSTGFFENKASGSSLNVALTVGAQNAINNGNIGLAIAGGYVRGFAMYTRFINSNVNLDRTDYNLLATNDSEITIYLPQMQLYDNGHVIRIKRLGAGAVNIGVQMCYIANGTRAKPWIIYDAGTPLKEGTIAIPSMGDACEFVWENRYGSYGAWIQYKMPKSW